jgi:hypothetical protein
MSLRAAIRHVVIVLPVVWASVGHPLLLARPLVHRLDVGGGGGQ